MENKSIITNLIPAIIFTIAFEGAILIGLLTRGMPISLMFVYPLLYFLFFIVTKANDIEFPLYFFIALTFVNANGLKIGDSMKLTLVVSFIGMLMLVSIANILKSIKKKYRMFPTTSIKESIVEKYQLMYDKDPRIFQRIILHSLVLFVAGIIGYLLMDYHGKWILITCGAVFIGDELHVLNKRGHNLVFGLVIACTLGSLIAYFQLPLVLRILIFIVAILGANKFMPKVQQKPNTYIIGSSMVAVMTMLSESFEQVYMTKDIIVDRFICGIIGIVIAILTSNIINYFAKEVYTRDNSIHQN
jgi:hypothetical protein